MSAVSLDVTSIDVDPNYFDNLLSQSDMSHISQTCLKLFHNVMSAYPILAIANSREAVARENYKYCFNNHIAVYAVRWTHEGTNPNGKTHKENELYRWLCNYHGCDYEYHDYMRKMMPPDCYVRKPE